jgi:hypothetical protein
MTALECILILTFLLVNVVLARVESRNQIRKSLKDKE